MTTQYKVILECKVKGEYYILSLARESSKELDVRFPFRFPHKEGAVGYDTSVVLADLNDDQKRALVRLLTRMTDRELMDYTVHIRYEGQIAQTWDFHKPD